MVTHTKIKHISDIDYSFLKTGPATVSFLEAFPDPSHFSSTLTPFWVKHLWVPFALSKPWSWDFPGGAVDKNPPANAGDTGSLSGRGRSHVPRSSWARAPQLLEPVLCSRRDHHNEKSMHNEE